MITLKNKTTNTQYVVNPTLFPDGTCQVWKLPDNILETGDVDIIWYYENDGEILQVLQAAKLLTTDRVHSGVGLIMPFLPYGRQDKEISNETTFGLTTLFQVLKTFPFKYIKTFDAHSMKHFNPELKRFSLPVDKYIDKALFLSNADLVCFPDKGASKRGYEIPEVYPTFNLDKKRNQSTGEIEGLVCSLPLNLKGKNVLIVDDLADGGRTFIEAAKLLYEMGALKVDLYVTHGIFSKGPKFLLDAGIHNIYTTDSRIHNFEPRPEITVFKLEF